MEETAVRLRKTFHYPTDNDSDDSLPEALDEEEQETYIHRLSAENQTRNKQYTRLFMAIPLLSVAPYLVALLSPSPSLSMSPLLALLSISSLLCSTWTLWALPMGMTGFPALDQLASASTNADTNESKSGNNPSSGKAHPSLLPAKELGLGLESSSARNLMASPHLRVTDGPLELYLPGLNAALAALLAVAGVLTSVRLGGEDEAWMALVLGILPAVVYAAVVVAKVVMASVDPTELERLKYGYKGA